MLVDMRLSSQGVDALDMVVAERETALCDRRSTRHGVTGISLLAFMDDFEAENHLHPFSPRQ